MTLLEWSTWLVFLSPLFQFLFHAIAARLYKGKSPQIVVLCAIFICAFVLLLWLGFLWSLDPNRTLKIYLICMLYFLVGYFAMAYSYFNLFNISETGRRLKILYELLQEDLTESKLTQIYGRDEIVQIRLDRLCAMGQLEKGTDGYRIKSKFLLFAGHCANFWRALLGFSANN